MTRPTMTDQQSQDEFYDFTRRLLIDAKAKRDVAKLRRAKIRIDGARFNALSDARQETLLQLFSEAMLATGAGAP